MFGGNEKKKLWLTRRLQSHWFHSCEFVGAAPHLQKCPQSISQRYIYVKSFFAQMAFLDRRAFVIPHAFTSFSRSELITSKSRALKTLFLIFKVTTFDRTHFQQIMFTQILWKALENTQNLLKVAESRIWAYHLKIALSNSHSQGIAHRSNAHENVRKGNEQRLIY